MSKYNHILIAVDLHPNCDHDTAAKGIELAKVTNAKVTILHAIEHINAYGVAQAYPTVLDLEAQMDEDAEREITQLRDKVDYPGATAIVEVGSPKIVIIDKAQELGVDLIVMGSHGRHGIGLLLGSTANAVLHHATCDVLAVRIKE